MFGLYLPILSLTLLSWLGSSEFELVPIMLIYGIGFSLLKVSQVVRTIILLRTTARTQRVRANNQSLLDWVVLEVLGIHRSIKARSFTQQQQIMLNAIRFLLHKPLDRVALDKIQELDCNTLFLIEDIESHLDTHEYTQAIPALNSVREIYGMNPWIYSRLRRCYLELNDFEGLDKLNFQTGSEVNIREGQVNRLVKELEATEKPQEKNELLGRIYKIAPDYEKYTEQYFRFLQESGEYDLLLRLIRSSWRFINSIPISRIVLEVFNTNTKMKLSDFVNSLPQVESYGYQLLKMHAYFSLGEINKAQSIVIELMTKNRLVSYIFQLELASIMRDNKLLSDSIHGILNTKLEEKTVGLDG